MAGHFNGEADATRLGSLCWLEESGLAASPDLQRIVAAARAESKSLAAIGWEGSIRGVFVFSEVLRSEAATTLARCAALGCDVAVLTGDEPARGQALAEQLGVAVKAGLLPAAKVAALAEARRSIGPVAMVGDGVNDAPALAASDVGIALGCGADLSRESAAVCLLRDDLAQVPWSIELARRGVCVIRQNLFWAFSYNTLGIALAAGGWLNPAWAAAAMVVSSLLVVTNSLRLQSDAPGEFAGEDGAADRRDSFARHSADVKIDENLAPLGAS
jgi:P-type E1-E2 ATPase